MPLDPSFRLDGASMADLSAQWWQWALSSPDETNPVVDATGEHCAVNQDGPVWFLAGAFGGAKVRRTCVVPAGKYLFFPAINMVYFPNPGVTDVTCEMAQAGAALNNDTALDVFVQVDGAFVPDPERFRVRTTQCFDVHARVPKGHGPGSAYPSASDGFWYLLPPLPPGEHRIKFGGRYASNADQYGGMAQDIEYRITVE